MNSRIKNEETGKYLLIKLQELELKEGHTISKDEYVYYSFSSGEKMHFSSVMDANALLLNDDILLPLSTFPESIELQRWQNHMILFVHEIDLGDLKSRTTVRKKVETVQGEVLSLLLTVLNEDQIKFGNNLIKSISQHYLIFSSFILKGTTSSAHDPGPSYFIMRTSQVDYAIPVIDGEVCIQLPENLEFEYVKNGKLFGKSRKYKTDELRESELSIGLEGEDECPDTQLFLLLKWGINLYDAKPENNLLLEAHELLIYEIQIKFDNYNQYSGSKVKFVYGNKSFDLGFEFSTPKPPKIRKIIFMMIKSEDEEISIYVERNQKVLAQSKFYTDQIIPYAVNNPKRKFFDHTGKSSGFIKFKCEKGKNLSTPNNNKLWKESTKKKVSANMILAIDQVSVNYAHNQNLGVIIKSQTEERMVGNAVNFEYFNKEENVLCIPVVITAKLDEQIYLMVKKMDEELQDPAENPSEEFNDFIGIAILNLGERRLGMNSVQIPFFKNQEKTVTVNCTINKILPYPFIKSIFQPELQISQRQKTLSLSIEVRKVVFTPYFYTFRYENKNQIYCIVEVNRLKKVLIMESSQNNQLVLTSTSNSDTLNFSIEDTEFLKIKIFFLVSDFGYEEEIYGSTLLKFKTGELIATGNNGLSFNKIDLKNSFGTGVGKISISAFKGNFSANLSNSGSKEKISPELRNDSFVEEKRKPRSIKTGPFKKELTIVRNDLEKVNQNMEIMQKSIEDKNSGRIKKKSVNPIRNLINQSKAREEYRNDSIRYNNKIKYGKDRRSLRNHSTDLSEHQNQSLVLPIISQRNGYAANNKSSLKNLVQQMKIGKKLTRDNGETEQSSLHQKRKRRQKSLQKDGDIIPQDLMERKTQNLEKNMNKLFPSHKKMKKEASFSRKEEDAEKEESPVVYYESEEKINNGMSGMEWEDNEFAINQ